MKALEKAIAQREAQALHVSRLEGMRIPQHPPMVKSAKRILAVASLRVEHLAAGGSEKTFEPSRDQIDALAERY